MAVPSAPNLSLFGGMPTGNPLIDSSLGAYYGLGGGLQNAMSQMWQVNQANQQAALAQQNMQQQMDMLNAQLGAQQNMQKAQLGQQTQNQAMGALTQLANTKQLGGILSNMFGGLGNALGGMFGGLGGAGGSMGSPLSFHSNSGAGISFGGAGGATPGMSPSGTATGGNGGYNLASLQAMYGPLYTGDTTTPMTGNRNITNPNAYGGGMHPLAAFGNPASGFAAAFSTKAGGHPMDPQSVLMRQFSGQI